MSAKKKSLILDQDGATVDSTQEMTPEDINKLAEQLHQCVLIIGPNLARLLQEAFEKLCPQGVHEQTVWTATWRAWMIINCQELGRERLKELVEKLIHPEMLDDYEHAAGQIFSPIMDG